MLKIVGIVLGFGMLGLGVWLGPMPYRSFVGFKVLLEQGGGFVGLHGAGGDPDYA